MGGGNRQSWNQFSEHHVLFYKNLEHYLYCATCKIFMASFGQIFGSSSGYLFRTSRVSAIRKEISPTLIFAHSALLFNFIAACCCISLDWTGTVYRPLTG